MHKKKPQPPLRDVSFTRYHPYYARHELANVSCLRVNGRTRCDCSHGLRTSFLPSSLMHPCSQVGHTLWERASQYSCSASPFASQYSKNRLFEQVYNDPRALGAKARDNECAHLRARCAQSRSPHPLSLAFVIHSHAHITDPPAKCLLVEQSSQASSFHHARIPLSLLPLKRQKDFSHGQNAVHFPPV